VAFLAGVVDLGAGGAEEYRRGVQQLTDGEDDHQQGDQRQVRHEQAVGGQRLPVEGEQPEHEALQGDDVGPAHGAHAESARGDRCQQREHQVIGRRRNVTNAVHHDPPQPQTDEPREHRGTGVDADLLRHRDPAPYRLDEVAQVPEQHQQHPEVEQPAEQPRRLARLEQAREQHELAEHAQHDPRHAGRRRGGGDLQR
jgi:hypothetical protein